MIDYKKIAELELELINKNDLINHLLEVLSYMYEQRIFLEKDTLAPSSTFREGLEGIINSKPENIKEYILSRYKRS
jgi:hypothetical protein